MANQLSSSLRMWPCTVCTAVFTHENGKNAEYDMNLSETYGKHVLISN